MCGLAGFWRTGVQPDAETLLETMGAALHHRGPDAQGTWLDGEVGIGMVHRRLSIQDLSPAGAQPMVSASGRFVMVFNGEIYNFMDLRRDLDGLGYPFRGHSDTEVMLAAFEHWGLQESLDRFNGMFAIAVLDREERALYLARDRMGEKPLYYGWQGSTFLFGSELKALRRHPDWQGRINQQALPLLLRHNLIPAPHSIHEGIFKLPPASWLRLDLDTPEREPVVDRYWRMASFIGDTWHGDTEQASHRLESLLEEVIRDQMISDVPLGAFLSGGVDSSTVAALMQKHASDPIRTFSIGFDEPGYNEAEHAARVARHLQTDHTELYVSADDALAVIPGLPRIYDEPFADSSQIPTYLVSRMTREHVTVALSGDGGDELFCGYTRYPGMARAWQERWGTSNRLRTLLALLPPALVAPLISTLVPSQWGRGKLAIQRRLGAQRAISSAEDLSEFYRQRVSFWSHPEEALLAADEPQYGLTGALPVELRQDPLKTLMWRDLNWYLPDDILTKVDRAAMACSLETRIPMLDRRIVEFALGLPTALNMSGGTGKQVLRKVLYRHVPRDLIDRPKQGFAVPLGQWLRGPLREWAEPLLDHQRLKEQGYWRPETIRWLWREHQRGREDYSAELWGILMFQAWHDEYSDGNAWQS
ncbi:asparagine synthase (glutamine-hydrolyzing) [Halovibrio salipaludis]|uniref:asparagine synthase (glutamine-hydrolyzing) n=1 Tax=Halovibrio salipaludis TaxID=2032626 RepID=A0A2A2F9H3_9GAMM|nr:asparagine synthase (glutamine-hydrolyzing) [Halovibrio salipaludis]PAU81203.1 asparagine synthase (glutamine-hydrolyzing) [Halovibrio salipaludis]